MHIDNKHEQQYSFYYSHICRRDYIMLDDDYNPSRMEYIYLPKNLPKGVRRLNVGYILHVGYITITEGNSLSATQYLRTTSSPQKKKSSSNDNYKISETN